MTPLNFECHKKIFNINFFDDKDHISRVARTSNTFYEIDLLDYIRSLGIRAKVAIDVGANIGNHSVYFGNFIADHVICVEANDELLPILESNCSQNQVNYEIIGKGLGEASGTASITFPIENNVGAAKLEKGNGDIIITTLDDVAPATGVDLVKIDVEGMELDVLLGARRLLSTQHPHLVIEAATEDSLRDIKKLLSTYNYIKLSKWNATPTYHFAYRPTLSIIWYARILKLKSRALHRFRSFISRRNK